MGRRAKTPFCSIRKLEDFPQPPTHVLGRTSSVDRIAEQYKAVLESRPRSLCWDDSSELELSPADSDTEQPVTLRQHRSSCCPGGDESCLSHPSRTAAFPKPSPMSSDDGTLVSFQEETVYFKPVSFPTSKPEAPSFAKPEPPTVPLSRQTTAAAADADADADENVSLQICLDLLTRELSSAMAARPSRASSMGSSALQVWVMIEAYEGLRDQMAELSRGNRQAREMERMFDMWLRALYSIHDSMRGVGGKDCGAELGTEALD
ncbi:hypothetical protein N657DRAFT_564290 [Parathielavia appendiculata]|uniref:Uncharacterized protein n=1 Tax=Parathielavia appendiculata TaxID=2587402 RepID=A0AAN6U8J1_9PEZI|nr:hypothetical protein N657DRAFT_564290 [Parathielavia appendiculata]